MPEINTVNDSIVGARGDRVVILNPRREMSKDEALRLAAWIVALASDDDEEWEALLKAVQST